MLKLWGILFKDGFKQKKTPRKDDTPCLIFICDNES